jgi:predicted lipoprotein with Yx(FWY)xxD motif
MPRIVATARVLGPMSTTGLDRSADTVVRNGLKLEKGAIMTRPSRLLLAALLPAVLLAVVVAGCGDNGNDVKAAAPSASVKSPSSGGATLGVRRSDLGTFVVDSKGRSLYLFEKDTGSKSMCSGACAAAWPPATVSGKPKADQDVDAGMIGTTTRADGTMQVTYGGHPLYRYAGDQAPGDTNGQDLDQFGGGWYVVSPSGHKIENEGETSSEGGGGSGY